MAILLFGCEEVIDVDLSTAAPRLVIEASIDWQKGTTGNLQTIKLSTTTGYYQNVIPKVSGATVVVTNSSNRVFNFTEEKLSNTITGKYTCTDFVPIKGETYTLTVVYNGQTYTASEKLYATPAITNVEQRNDLGFNSDEIGIRVNFKDFSNETNFYLSRFDSSFIPFPEYTIVRDEFSPGNNIPVLYSNEDLVSGSIVKVKIFGVSEMYYNYMNLIIGNVESSGPFQTPPTRVRGNIINQTNVNNYAFGYFRLGEVEQLDYTIK
nr:DUF4249 domain-containing protein [uncultured Flavobacterium sp.]